MESLRLYIVVVKYGKEKEASLPWQCGPCWNNAKDNVLFSLIKMMSYGGMILYRLNVVFPSEFWNEFCLISKKETQL